MTEKKNIGGIIALIAGILLLLTAATIIIVRLVQTRKEKEDEGDIQKEPVRKATSSQTSSSGGPSELIKKMQAYLLNIGINYGNNDIIDAIQLTGGVDGYRGDGFELALLKAIENGYVKSENDLLSRVS